MWSPTESHVWTKKFQWALFLLFFDHIDFINREGKEDNYTCVKEAQKRLLQLAYNLGLSKCGI